MAAAPELEEVEESELSKIFGDPAAVGDPLKKERYLCLDKHCDVKRLFKVLEECTCRVKKKAHYTAENCHQEMVDLIEAVDHCVDDKAFKRLK